MRILRIHDASWLAVLTVLCLGGENVVAGTTVTAVATDPLLAGAQGITTDGVNFYVTRDSSSGAGVISVPIGGGAVTSLYSNLVSPAGIAVIGSNLYWIDPNSGPITDTQILTAPNTGGGPITAIYTGSNVGQPIVDGVGLTTDGTKLFAADEVQGRVFSLNPDGSGLTQLGGNRYGGYFDTEHWNSITTSGGIVYVADSGKSGVISPEVISIPATGGSFTTLSSGSPLVSPYGIAVGGSTIYIADQGADSIWSVPITGGTPTLYASDPRFDRLYNMTYYDGALYVADTGNGTTGTIWKVTSSAIPEPGTLTLLVLGMAGLMAYGGWRPRHGQPTRGGSR